MKLLFGPQLVRELRTFADNVSYRLWVAVPYIGSPISIRKILGKQWFDNPSVNVKLLTDTSDLSCINTETLQLFHDRGQVKTLLGLHAKIYIVDDICIVTSANLTSTAFSKRHEIGFGCDSEETKQIIALYNSWWQLAENVKPDQLHKIFKSKTQSKEETGTPLPTLFKLPNDPGSFVKNLAKRFLNYDRLVADYEDFANKYSMVQRIWRKEPLYFEIDGLFNYLYHEAPQTPSFSYAKKSPRMLSQTQQMQEIEKWAINYKEWNAKVRRGEQGEEDIKWRLNNSKILKRMLVPTKVLKLTKDELDQIFHCLNSLNSYPINRTKILNNNKVADIRTALNELVNGDGQLAARMDYCNNIKNLGSSSMNEILGFTNPDKYPLINKNSNCGLRYFGYQVKAYN
ncbi:phospholipase D family protein [candidate division TA06 bacterium]|nr:phospholipase D family protein [candidate division TA06 bacterium]